MVAEEETAIRSAYLSIARELGLVDAQADIETAVSAVKAWLSREDGWLLVFDNADDPILLRAYLPPTRTGGKVLLTSRAKSFVNVGIREPFRVETLDLEDAVTFLIERTSKADAQAAAELAAELGYLPLALEQAAAYIYTLGCVFAEYLTRYRRLGVSLLEKGKPSTDYTKTVATTWTLSFEAVRQASPASAELLTAAAFLVPDLVPIEIFTRGGSELGDLLAKGLKGADEDPLVFWELLEPLERYSLVERLPDDAFKLHRLTQEVIKDSLGGEGRRAWAERVVRALDATFPDPEPKVWDLCERLQPNARLASDLTRVYALDSVPAGRFLNNTGKFASDRGDLGSAKLLLQLSIEISKRVLGAEHRNTLMSRSNLACTLLYLGDLDGAKRLEEQTLELSQRVLGEEHPGTSTSRSNLAEILRALGDPAAAKKLQEQVLETRERVLGAEHFETLAARNNLTETLRDLGALADARRLQEQNLEISERVLGDRHPHTTIHCWNLLRTVIRLKDSDAESKLKNKLRWLLDRDEDSISSVHQRNIRQYLLNLLNPS